MIAGMLLLSVLPFLLSLFGRAQIPRMLCFVCSLLAMLLSVLPCHAMLPWGIGMAIGAISVRERILHGGAA